MCIHIIFYCPVTNTTKFILKSPEILSWDPGVSTVTTNAEAETTTVKATTIIGETAIVTAETGTTELIGPTGIGRLIAHPTIGTRLIPILSTQ